MHADGSAGVFSLRARTVLLRAVLFFPLACNGQAHGEESMAKNITPASSGYKTEIFNLVDPDGNQSGTAIGRTVSSAFDNFLNLAGQDSKTLRKRLLSGPATEGGLWKIGESREWLYHLCQAHQCNVTNVALLYDEQSHRMAGRLLYRCESKWLGNPSAAERALIEREFPVKIDPDDARIFCRKG
ncbi:hypothetical protein WT01_02650 [Burkholderia cepacia]|uniref:Uncharacterized protein n=1 Tax=Burkholderia cepacia TaxID=292 RepID=A0A118KE82_BURCE|nr:hypothetical protein [Burkholderia cepacia]KVK75239.1 hypothetical protein WS90_29455 [Burkholderia cepacia]KVL44662.1 hypothetical protein WT01_02650 [Burkholderia cepacia]